jgi:hypothetical protein
MLIKGVNVAVDEANILIALTIAETQKFVFAERLDDQINFQKKDHYANEGDRPTWQATPTSKTRHTFLALNFAGCCGTSVLLISRGTLVAERPSVTINTNICCETFCRPPGTLGH